MNITGALYAVLVADATLTDLLSTYKGAPAVFSSDPVPKDATWPWLVISGSEADDDFGAKNEAGRSITRRIRIYDDAEDGSVLTAEAIGERVRDLFHRLPFAVTGGTVYMVDASGPIAAPSGPDVVGRAVVLRFLTSA